MVALDSSLILRRKKPSNQVTKMGKKYKEGKMQRQRHRKTRKKDENQNKRMKAAVYQGDFGNCRI